MMKKSLLLLLTFLPLTAFSQTQEVDAVGHAHMDMNWLWTIDRSQKMSLDNMRQVVRFMEEYPDYKAVQSQAQVYKFVEDNDPELFRKLQRYVREGRLEIVGGTWTESDNILPSGEALGRSFLLGQSYFKEKFGTKAQVGWMPDDFGHNSQLPQIMNLSGIKYYLFARAPRYHGSFLWEGSDGSSVIAYNPEYYGVTDPDRDYLKRVLEDYPAGGGKTLIPTGSGDHGGGPSRKVIDFYHEADADSTFSPRVKFTTASEFFESIEPYMSERPVHKGEMQFIFEGCYTAVADMKSYNRKCESALYEDEYFNTLNYLAGIEYPRDFLNDTWRTLCFNQFHDILPGTAVNISNRESIARYQELYGRIRDNRDRTFWKLSDRIPFKEGIGQPVVAFNMQPYERKALVSAEIFSYDMPVTTKIGWWLLAFAGEDKHVIPTDGNHMSVYVRDDEGNTYPAQIVGGEDFPPGYRPVVQFLVDKMPAGGYKTFYIDVTRPAEVNDSIPYVNGRYETDYYSIGINDRTGNIDYLLDKSSGRQFVRPGEELNTLKVYMEYGLGGMPAWTINEIQSVSELETVPGSVKILNGLLRTCVECDKVWGESTFHVRTIIYKSYPRIDYDIDMHWLEFGTQKDNAPMLRAVFPLNMGDSTRMFCHTSFDVVERPANGKYACGPVPLHLQSIHNLSEQAEHRYGQEVPAHYFSDVCDGQAGFAILSNLRYGFCYDKDEFSLALMRSSVGPDPYPNIGVYNVTYAICPHKGDWKDAGVLLEGEAYNNPVYACEPLSTSMKFGKKKAPFSAELFQTDSRNIQLTAIKKAQKGREVVIRFAEMEGKETTVTLTLPVKARKARRLNLLEEYLPDASKVQVDGNRLTVTVKPHEIVTIGVRCRKLRFSAASR